MPATMFVRCSALALCLVAAPAGAWELDCMHAADREVSIDTAGADRIEVVGRAGDLDIRTAAGTTLVARGRACASSVEYLAQTQLRAVREGRTVKVFVQVPEGMKGIGLLYATLDLVVSVPAGPPVEVTDTSGDTTITGVNVTKLTDSSGDVVARGVTGNLEINDSSGDIRIEQAAGTVTIVDSSGDIVIRGAGNVVVRSDSSGDVDVAQVAGDVRIENDSSGDISIADVGRNVAVLADTSGSVHVSGVKGTVSVPQ